MPGTRCQKFSEGAVFLVPLPTGGFCVGVLVRANGRGSAYGAFFGPRVADAREADVERIRETDAILHCRFGDYGLYNNLWPVIGLMPDWAARRWRVPQFIRGHDDPALCYVTTYDDDLRCIDERLQPVIEAPTLLKDSQYGSGIVEIRLAELLAK